MRLSDLITDDHPGRDVAHRVPGRCGLPDPEIRGVASDSRAVRPGYLFAALPGTTVDGRCYIADAVARGAVAVLASDAAGPISPAPGAFIVRDENPHRRLALVAARFYGRQPNTVVAVSGTNGKTSVVEFTRQLWAATGVAAASIGTLGVTTDADRTGPGLTTPDPIALHAQLRDLAASEIDHLALEASSHGLDQHRLDGVWLRAAAFTNLSRDHLDYHRSMSRYLAAKRRLFAELLSEDGTAVLNDDAPESVGLAATCRARGLCVVTFGTSDAANLALIEQSPEAGGQRLDLRLNGHRHQVVLPLVGAFQALNVLAALALVAAVGDRRHPDFLHDLEHIQGIPGRLQQVAAHPSGAAVYVDFAHTPEALRTMLAALRPHVAGRLVCVFGAGGDRDRDKRAMMGRAVAAVADAAIVTDDNPRSESPGAIRQAVLRGCPDARSIPDRADAIAAGLSNLQNGDALVIAGKGHEQGQIVGTETRSFDDATVARQAAMVLGGESV